MYKCTECNAVYDICPDYCDCGNDVFEEVIEEEFYDDEPRKAKKRQKLTPQEIAEIEEEKMDRKKSLVVAVIALVLGIGVLFLPPHVQTKQKVVEKNYTKVKETLPAVNSYWDNTIVSTMRQANDPFINLPLLNANLGSISNQLKDYLYNEVGGAFNRKWNRNLVTGSGTCIIMFKIDKEGKITSKIDSRSYNESLDDSISLMLSQVTSVEVPPSDYNGEKIKLSFSVGEGGIKVSYPNVSR